MLFLVHQRKQRLQLAMGAAKLLRRKEHEKEQFVEKNDGVDFSR